MMKKILVFSLVLAAGLAMSAFNTASNELAIGEGVPLMHIEMKDISGTQLNLRNIHQENGLLVIFSCNTCPFVIKWEDRYNDLYEQCKQNNIGMVLVNSNEAKRTGDDSLEKMQAKAQAEGYKMHYVVDAGHQIADAFGARTTPHVFLFNRDAKLAYRGLIDDKEEKADVTQHYLKDAITNMVAGQSISNPVTKARGCSIKRTTN